jgi:hypothetical protein
MITAVPVGALAVATGLVPVEADGRLGTGPRLFSDLSFPPQPLKIKAATTIKTTTTSRFLIIIYLFSFSNFSARKCLNPSISAGTSKPRNSLWQS